MSVLLGHNIKIFVTENVDSKGYIKLTNFTDTNTKQLLVSVGSFIYTQEHLSEVQDLSLGISSGSQSEAYAGGVTKTGSLTLRCLLNSSKADGIPFDKILWDSITKESVYPTGWTTTASEKTLPLNRTAKNIKPFGIVAIVDGIAYLFDACRIAEASIQLDIKELAHVGWSMAYIKHRRINGVVLGTGVSTFTFTGSLIGSASRTNIEDYNLAASKLMRTTVLDRNTSTTYTLASINSTIVITNSLIFLDNMNVGEDTRLSLFAGAGNYAINSTVGFYTRASGDSYTLLNHITNNEISNSNRHQYKVTIDVLNTGGTDTLAQVVLDGVRMTMSETAGTVMSSTANIKAFKSEYSANSGIKFCS